MLIFYEQPVTDIGSNSQALRDKGVLIVNSFSWELLTYFKVSKFYQ